jgi:hypothetical protein
MLIFLQLPLLNSSSQQSSLCQVRRCCFFCSYHYSTAAHSRAASARPGGADFLQPPLLNSSSQQSSLCKARRCCFFAAAITQQQLTAEQPVPGQALLHFCSCHYSTAAHSRAAYARPGFAGCFFATTITQQQLTAELPMPGQAVLIFSSYQYSRDHAPVPLLQLTLGKTPIGAGP